MAKIMLNGVDYSAPVASDITPANIGAAPTSHASSSTTYGISTASSYGHAMASATTPKANGTASVGSETAKFARGDHVHPLQTSVTGSSGSCTGNAATATKATNDGSGNNIVNTYAKKSIYGDTFVSMGRKAGTTVGTNSFAFGFYTTASGYYSHAEGSYTTASAGSSHAEGSYTTASNSSSHAEGYATTASGYYSHAEGDHTTANIDDSHAEGYYTTASNFSSHVCGKRNKTMIMGGSDNNQIGDVFVIGNGTSDSARSNALRVTFAGDVLGTKAFQSSGADYAEFIKPWADGNIYGEDRVGYFVTVKDGLLYKAGEGDYIIGITSGNPSVVGNADEDYYWRYERDEFNRIVMEDVPEMKIKTETVRMIVQKTETKIEYVQPDDEDWDPEYDKEGNPVPNEIPYEATVFDDDGNPIMEEIEDICPVKDERTGEYVMEETGKIIKKARMKLAEDYDPSKQDSYVPRADRPEWYYVGMVGVLPVRDDGTCLPGQFCKCGGDGIATLTAERGFDTYMVLERIAENVVSVILK